jgi:hypothetical protein
MLERDHPNSLIADFIVYMTERDLKPYVKLQAKSAAILLLEQLKNIRELGKDTIIKDFLAGTDTYRPAKPRYTTIWDITILLDYIRRSKPLLSLSMLAVF